MPHAKPLLVLAASGLLLTACQLTSTDDEPGLVTTRTVSAPLDLDGKAYDRAMTLELPPVDPLESDGLHNLFHLSDAIVSGSEPHGEGAFDDLEAMGIKTIISVDGKAPDVAAAEARGMRYVHIPIQYSSISNDEMIKLAKTYRELEPPFYVHCFHGRHRGPAGAEVGRLILDGIERDEAIAEMRQYCGTSKKYEGLYRIIAAGDIPTAAESAAFDYDFAPIDAPEGVVGSMVLMSRAHDNIVILRDNGWQPDPAHPDLDVLNEVTQLVQAFELGEGLQEVRTAADDYRSWWDEGRDESRLLLDALRELTPGSLAAAARADMHFEALRQSCSDCHGEYRNL